MLRRDLRTPLYHPFYVNYGFNKVSFVESLRFESGKKGRKGGIMRRLSVPFDCDGLRVRLSASDVGSREGDEAKIGVCALVCAGFEGEAECEDNAESECDVVFRGSRTPVF